MNLVKNLVFATLATAAFVVAPVFVHETSSASVPSCCVGGNCCANGKCCNMAGCCKADKSCCDPIKGVCTVDCGCPTMNCCAVGSGAKTAKKAVAVKNALSFVMQGKTTVWVKDASGGDAAKNTSGKTTAPVVKASCCTK